MAFNIASLTQRSKPKPPRLCVYGTGGIGKTQFGQMAPSPVFLQFEDSPLDVPTFGLIKRYEDMIEAIGSLYNDPHNFQTVVADSADWLEPLIWAKVARENKWSDIGQADFGKGYALALDVWRQFFDAMNDLRDDRGMTIIILAHAEAVRFESPDAEPYQRYQPKLHKRASALLQEHVDALLFANYRVSTATTDVGFNKKVVRGVGGGQRLLFTTERPAYLAKNRYGLPDTIPLDWNAFAANVPYYNGNNANETNNTQQPMTAEKE